MVSASAACVWVASDVNTTAAEKINRFRFMGADTPAGKDGEPAEKSGRRDELRLSGQGGGGGRGKASEPLDSSWRAIGELWEGLGIAFG